MRDIGFWASWRNEENLFEDVPKSYTPHTITDENPPAYTSTGTMETYYFSDQDISDIYEFSGQNITNRS
jgi:hypothetical protein